MAHHFYKRGTHTILYATFQLRIAAAKSWWGRRHYDCIVCPSVTSEPRRRVEDGVAYTLKHIFKCIGKNGMGNIFFFQYFYSLSSMLKPRFENQLFVYGCKQVNVYISDIHWSSNRPKAYLFDVHSSKQYIHIKSDDVSYALVWMSHYICKRNEHVVEGGKGEEALLLSIERIFFNSMCFEFYFWQSCCCCSEQTNAFAGCCCF